MYKISLPFWSPWEKAKSSAAVLAPATALAKAACCSALIL